MERSPTDEIGNVPVTVMNADDLSPEETDDVMENLLNEKEKETKGHPIKEERLVQKVGKERNETTHGAVGGGGEGGKHRPSAAVHNKKLDDKIAPEVEEPEQEGEDDFEEDWIKNEAGGKTTSDGAVRATILQEAEERAPPSEEEEDSPEVLEMPLPAETGSPDEACADWSEEEPEAIQCERRRKQEEREEAEREEMTESVTYYQPRRLNTKPPNPSGAAEDYDEEALLTLSRIQAIFPSVPGHSVGAMTSLLSGLTDLWLNQECTDTELQVDTTVFRCHRTVLAPVSGYFRSMLASGMRESHSLRMHVSEVSPETMAAVLEALYQQRDDVITPENVDDIFRAAAFLQISFLEKTCCRVMKQCLSVENCLGVWRLGRTHNCVPLQLNAATLIQKHFPEVAKTQEFEDLELDDLQDLLSALPVDKVIGEEVRAQAILTWVEAQEEERGGHLVDLLQEYVCAINLSKQFVFKELYSRMQRSKDERFRKHVDDILAYHLDTGRETEVASRQKALRSDKYRRVHLVLCGAFTHGDPQPNLACLDPESKQWYTLHAIKREWMPGDDFATCVLDNKVYVTGGSRTPQQTLRYCPGSNEWRKVKDMLSPREQHAMAAVQDKLYIVGGHRSGAPGGSRGPVAEVEAYDVSKDSWNHVGALMLPVEAPSCGVLDDQIYVMGGRDDDDDATCLIQVFNPATGTCSRLGNLPCPTASSRAVVHQGALWAVLQDGAVVKVKANGEVKQVATLPGGEKRQFGVWVENNDLWVVGGLDATDQILDTILAVNLTSGKMKARVEGLPIPFFGFSTASVVISKELLLLPGFMLQEELTELPPFRKKYNNFNTKKI